MTAARACRQLLFTLVLVVGLKTCTGVFEASAQETIRIEVNPRLGYAPLTLRVKLMVQPHPDNRIVCLTYDGPVFSSSCWDHIGEDAPRTTWKELRNLPEGAYVVLGEVRRAGGRLVASRETLCVLGPATEASTC